MEVELKQKLSADPMKDIKAALKEKDKAKKRKHNHHHSGEKDRHKSKSAKSNTEPAVTKKSKTIEELRAERLKRENEARVKTNQLLYGVKPVEKVEVDDRKRRYNNQFNPDASRY